MLRRLPVLILVVLLAACAALGPRAPVGRSLLGKGAFHHFGDRAATTSTTAAAESEDLEGRVQREEAIEFTTGLMLDIHAPRTGKHHPVAVLVHGGGWVTGHRYTMSRLADALAARAW